MQNLLLRHLRHFHPGPARPSAARRAVAGIEILESRIAPAGVTSVVDIVRAGGAAAETSAGSVAYTVTFNGAVSGVDAADFQVHTDGTASAAPLLTVTKVNATTYTVTVGGLHGEGDVRLDLVDNDSITGPSGVLGGAGANNGSFTGAAYHLLPTFPKIESITAIGATSTGADSVSWTVTLSAPVTGVDATDFTLLKTGVNADAAVTVTPVSSTVYTVTATGLQGTGTLALRLVDDGTIRDAGGNPLQRTAPPAFTALTEPVTGDYPNSVVVTDLNGDGKLDLVTTNQGANSVSVLLGDGSGGFGAKTDYAVGGYPDCVAVADLNGDGIPDLVNSNSNNNSLSVRLGDGNGGFGAQTFVTTGNKPHFVAVADLNHDGKPDLVAVSYASDTVSVLLGNGSGGFAAKMDFATGSTPYALAVADLNGDGKLDVAVANSGGSSVSVLLGTGTGSLGAKTDFATGAGTYSVVVADVNRDGLPDLVTANNSANTVSVLLGDGHGSFGTNTDFPTGNLPTFVTVRDVNGDGRLDLVAANSGGNTAGLLLGDGSGGFAAQTTFAAKTTPRSLAVADVNGDGRADFVITNSGSDNVSVLLGAGATTFTGDSFTITTPQAVAVDVAPGSVAESSTSGLVYTFTRTGSTSLPLTVSFTKGGTAAFTTDYTASSSEAFDFTAGTVTIPAGSSTATLTLVPVDDRLVEGSESAILTLARDAGFTVSGAAAAGTITDNDTATIALAAPDTAPGEGAGTKAALFTLTLHTSGTGPEELATAVSFHLSDLGTGTATGGGVDYAFTTTTLSFPVGATSGQTRLASFASVTDDAVVEHPETVNLSATIDAGPATLFGSPLLTTTIEDNDTATITLTAGLPQLEGDSGVTTFYFTAKLDHAVQGGFSVDFATSDGTATAAGGDYDSLSGTLTFAGQAGETKTFGVSVHGDTHVETDEVFHAALGALNGAPAGLSVDTTAATATILNDDRPAISIDNVMVTEGNPGDAAVLAKFTVTLSDPSAETVTVDYATADGTAIAPGDYTPLAHSTLTFAPGEISKTISVPIRSDSLFESGLDETFLVKLSNPTHATLAAAEGVGTITSDDGTPAHTLSLDATHPRTFFDRNHDKVTVRLSGLGTGTLILAGGATDGADISEILVDSNAAKSTLSVTVVKDRINGDGLVGLGEVRVNGGLAGFTGPAVDFTAGGLRAPGVVKTITAHALLAGELITGGTADDKLALHLGGALGVAGDSFAIATPETISVLKAASAGPGLIQAGALTSITTTAGALAADITSLGAIGSVVVKGGLSGNLVASRFGAVTVTGGGFSGSLTSTATAVALGKTKALTSLSVTGGDLSGDVNLLGASGAITVKTGGLSGHLAAASFGAVAVTGGDFSGAITSLTPAAALGRNKALTSLTVTDGNLTGDVRLLGASGAITVKSKPALARGDVIGASIVASAIASLSVGRDFISSIVLAGADLGADYAFGGDADTFAAGTIGAVKIGRNASGAGSIIGAGFDPSDGAIKDGDDAIIGGVASVIASLTVTGTAAPESYFAAGLFKTAPKIAGKVVTLAGDGRFKVG